MFSLSAALLLLFSTATVRAIEDLDSACAYACVTPLSSIQFDGDLPEQDYYAAECTNQLRVQSTFVCMRSRCTEIEIAKGYDTLSHDCETYGMVSLLPWSTVDNITQADEASFTVVTANDLITSGNPDLQIFNQTVLLDDALFQISSKTIRAWDMSEITRANYGYAMYGFWAVVLLVGIINRITSFTLGRKLANKRHSASKVSSLRVWTQRHVTTPGLIGHQTAEPFGWCTVPARLQSMTIISFLTINVILSFVSYDVFSGNLYWADNKTQWWRYFADRTGCLAMANMPLMFAFATRNNVLIWLTGWSFATFNQFHRWVARIATVEAVLHSIGYTVEVFREGGKAEFVEEWAERYWWMGAIATIVMSLLCGLSIYPIRRLFYEAFLLVHIASAGLFLAAMYYHVYIFEGEYNGYIWPCVAVWVFDRVLRVAHLVFVNLSSCKATVSYNSDANIVRLNVPVRKMTPCLPGTYYYIYVLNSWKFWESHPFTLSSWTPVEGAGEKASNKTVSFLIRPYDGFTSRLRALALSGNDVETTARQPIETSARVVIEGPYGISHTLEHFDSALLVIGGSGITVALAHIRALYSASFNSRTQLRLQRLHLVWAVRDPLLFQNVFDNELTQFLLSTDGKGLASKLHVQIDLYVTDSTIRSVSINGEDVTVQKPRTHSLVIESNPLNSTDAATTTSVLLDEKLPRTSTSTTSSGSDPSSSSSPTQNQNRDSNATTDIHTTFHKRPHVHDIIVSSAKQYATSGNTLAVVSCGPAQMADDARGGIVSALGTKDEGVCEGLTWFDERFGW